MNKSWKDDYADLVATIVAGQRDINLDALCDRLGLLKDELETISARLVERGVIGELNA